LSKPLADLSLDNLQSCPVWRHELRGKTEFVEPAPDVLELADDGGLYVVLTRFVLADCTICWGFCSPCDRSGVDYTQPTIITPSGHVPFYYNGNPGSRVLEASLRLLAKSHHEVFPVSFEAQVATEGQRYSGVLREFVY
jgi:hypothetical protein